MSEPGFLLLKEEPDGQWTISAAAPGDGNPRELSIKLSKPAAEGVALFETVLSLPGGRMDTAPKIGVRESRHINLKTELEPQP